MASTFGYSAARSEIINVGARRCIRSRWNTCSSACPCADVSVAGEPNPITGQVVSARFKPIVPEDLTQFRKKVRAYCATRLAPYKVPVRIPLAGEELYSKRLKKMRRVPS